MTNLQPGPLSGLTVIELAAQGPLPLAATMLADAGASVTRVVRPGTADRPDPATDTLGRSRRSIVADLKHPEGLQVVRELIDGADVLLEGYRPGVLERLGLDPIRLQRTNRKLVIGRMTGWGQSGPLANAAGHDINYLGLTGLLDAIGTEAAPVPPLNLVADYGGGGMLLAFGVVAACLRAARTGEGEIIDAAMVDGAAILGATFYSLEERGLWGARGTNLLDGGAHYYNAYQTADGRWMSVGAIEPQFYRALLQGLGIDPASMPQADRARWPEFTSRFTTLFAARTQAEWTAVFDGVDACVAPVTRVSDARVHPHAVAREAFVSVGGHPQPAPAPRFASAASPVPVPARLNGTDTTGVLRELGRSEEQIEALVIAGAVETRKESA